MIRIEDLKDHASILTLRTGIIEELLRSCNRADIFQPELITAKADKLWEWVIKPITEASPEKPARAPLKKK